MRSKGNCRDIKSVGNLAYCFKHQEVCYIHHQEDAFASVRSPLPLFLPKMKTYATTIQTGDVLEYSLKSYLEKVTLNNSARS